MTEPIEDEFTEMFDATIPRVDLVGKGANGMPFLIAKSADGQTGLIDDATVTALISKSANPNPEATVTDTATIDPVAKEGEDLDASTVLAEPEGDTTGSDTTPGSPAWEATDAATARKWTSILSRAKNALSVLAEREGIEASSSNGEGDDFDNQWNLQDASCAIDYAISVLAPYAVGEQVEADLAAEDGDLIAKSMAGFDTDALELIEILGPVTKAGRTLSASNESAIRGAVESLQNVLASLPSAPDDTTGVTKSEEATVASTPDMVDEAISRVRKALDAGGSVTIQTGETAEVIKAKGDPQVAVYDANGTLVGTIDEADLNPIAAPKPPAEGETSGADDTNAAVIPGTDTVQAPAAAAPAVAKATEGDPVAAVIKEALAPLTEQLGMIAGLVSTVEGLKVDVAKMAQRPDNRNSPLLNGADGTTAGTVQHDPAGTDPLEDLQKAVAEATTDADRDKAKSALAFAALKTRFTPGQ